MFNFLKRIAASIQNPAANRKILFLDDTDDKLKIKDSNGDLESFTLGEGTASEVAFFDTSNTLTSSSDLYWDSDNGRLGVGTTTPIQTLDIKSGGTYGYNGSIIAQANPSIYSWFFGGAGNLTQNGVYNTAMGGGPGGAASLSSLTTGYENAAFGAASQNRTTSGYLNSSFGNDTLPYNTTGFGNSAFGWGAGLAQVSGAYNGFFGYGSDCIAPNLNNAYAIGTYARVGSSDTIVLGATGDPGGIGATPVRVLFGSETRDNYGGNFDIRSAYAQRNANVPAQLFVADNTGIQTADTGGAIDFGGYHATDAPFAGRAYSWARIQGLALSSTGAGGYLSFMVDNGAYVLAERMRINYNGNVGIGTPTPAESSILDLTSTTKGLLPPRMTATQASAIVSPAEGLLLYVTNTNGTFTTKGWWGYDGAAWKKLDN